MTVLSGQSQDPHEHVPRPQRSVQLLQFLGYQAAHVEAESTHELLLQQ